MVNSTHIRPFHTLRPLNGTTWDSSPIKKIPEIAYLHPAASKWDLSPIKKIPGNCIFTPCGHNLGLKSPMCHSYIGRYSSISKIFNKIFKKALTACSLCLFSYSGHKETLEVIRIFFRQKLKKSTIKG